MKRPWRGYIIWTMIRSSWLEWRRPLGLFFLAVLLVTGACSSEGDLVATVNGESIHMAEIEDREAAEDETVIDRVDFLDRLHSVVIVRVVVTKAREEFGIDLDQDPYRTAAEEEYQTLKSDLVAEFGDYEAALASQGITDYRVRVVTTLRVMIDSVYEELAARAPAMTSQEVEEVFETNRTALTEVCATHVLLDTRQEAEAVLERARAGEEMSALAAELSVEPGASESGGDLGCQMANSYVTEFAEAVVFAEVGVPYGPVESLFGHHVLVVTERDIPLLADHEDGIRADFEEEQRPKFIEEWFLRVAAESDVQVEPQYGTWVAEPTPQVLPPS